MVVLGVDSATADAVVGVTADGEVVREAQVGPGADGRPRHSQVLLPEIERCVDAAGGWERIDRIAVGDRAWLIHGPPHRHRDRAGARAGERDTDRAGRHSERALARGISAQAGGDGALALPVIDARRGEVFARPGRGGRVELWPPFVAPPNRAGGSGAEARSRASGGRGRGATIRRTAGGRRRHGCPARGPDPPTRREARLCDRGGGGRGVTGLDPTPVSETARCKEMA